MNLTTVHYIVLAFGSLAVGLPQLESSFPVGATPALKAAAGVCALLATVLGILSTSPTAPAALPPAVKP